MHLPRYKITAEGTVSILISAHSPSLLQFGTAQAGSCTSAHSHPHGMLTDPLSLTPVPKAPRKALIPPHPWRSAGCFLLSHSVVSYRARKSEVGNGCKHVRILSHQLAERWWTSFALPFILKFELFLFCLSF